VVIDFAEVHTGLTVTEFPDQLAAARRNFDPTTTWKQLENIPDAILRDIPKSILSKSPPRDSISVPPPAHYRTEAEQQKELEDMFPDNEAWKEKVSTLFVRRVKVPNGTTYKPGAHDGHARTHNGQMKLLVNEAHTVACQLMRYRQRNKDVGAIDLLKNTVVLCLGAASGNARQSHFSQLVHVFPGVHWVLYDPHHTDTTIFGKHSKNVHVYQKIFDATDTIWWQKFRTDNVGVNLIILSDIRSDLWTSQLHMRRMVMWRLLISMIARSDSNTDASDMRGMLNFVLNEETYMAGKNSMRIRTDNLFQDTLVTKIGPSCASLKYVAEWRGHEELFRRHESQDKLVIGALMRQFAPPPSSTELRHTVVGAVPVYVGPLNMTFPTHSINPQFGHRGYFHQDYLLLISEWMPSCTNDTDVMLVDQNMIEKQCFVANQTPDEQQNILDVCQTVLQRCQQTFGMQQVGLTITPPPARWHHASPGHAIQTMMGQLLEIYWDFRCRNSVHPLLTEPDLHKHLDIFWKEQQPKDFMDSTIKPFLRRYARTQAYRYALYPYNAVQDTLIQKGSRVGDVLRIYARELMHAIIEPRSYMNSTDREPTAPLYAIPCTAECMYLLVVLYGGPTDTSFSRELREMVQDRTLYPYQLWFVKHALAQLTSSGYGAVLLREGQLATRLTLVLNILREIMELPELHTSKAYLDDGDAMFVYTDPGCWGPAHMQACREQDFLSNRHWQIEFYNVMLPRLLDECKSVQLEDENYHLDRFIQCISPYQSPGTLLYNLHAWPIRSPVLFYVAQHRSDNKMVLRWICKHIRDQTAKKGSHAVNPYTLKRKRDGNTVLHLAAYHGNVHNVFELFNLTNNEGNMFQRMLQMRNNLTSKGKYTAKSGETPLEATLNRLHQLRAGVDTDLIFRLNKVQFFLKSQL